LFDGVCNLCNGAVDFILKVDRKKQFRFVALQSEAGEKIFEVHSVPPETDAIVLFLENKAFTGSDAAIEIARLLPFPWKLAVAFKVVPKKTRDKVYRWIAKNRYRWFGERETCRIPAPQEKLFFPEIPDLEF
jgi:predicted DCC family thiol-disulfide oxidoreductase YuxK